MSTPPPLPGGPAESSGPPPLPGGPGQAAAPQRQQPQRQQPQPPASRASLQRTEQTRTYPCQQCAAQLVFDIESQLLRCPSCGNQQKIVEAQNRPVASHDYDRMFEAQARAVIQAGTEKEIVCQNCGGHTAFGGTLTATRCPYCATPIQRDDVHDAPNRLPVDGMLPFEVSEQVARQEVEAWIKSRWFAPTEFKKYSELGSFASVYASYFAYDAKADTDYRGERGTRYTVTTGSGDNRRTETRVRWSPARGRVHNVFDDVLVLANTGLDREKVAELEPWPTEKVRPYSPEYIAGHLSRTYDRTAEDCFGDAKAEMGRRIEQTVRGDIGGDEQRVHSMDVNWSDRRFSYLLLPIWLLTVTYEGKPFQVCINGISGEVQGQRPISKIKVALAALAALIVVVGLIVLYLTRGG